MADDYRYIPCTRDQGELLADWLLADRWPFHRPLPERDDLLRSVAEGGYGNDRTRTFWMIAPDGQRVGLIQLRDIGDLTPVFDLRIGGSHRGRGLGRKALRWLTAHLFMSLPEIRRVEGVTRVDNVAMRKIFVHCGYVKEAYYRSAWPDGEIYHDAVGYAILRDDWVRGTVTLPRWEDEPT